MCGFRVRQRDFEMEAYIIIQMLKKFLFGVLLVCVCMGTKLTIDLESHQEQCFFEVLQAQQKYSVDAKSLSQGKYEMEIRQWVDNGWNKIVQRQVQEGSDSLNVHKLAAADSTYSFCLRNIDEKSIRLSLNIQSGLELHDFEMLPDSTDSENLQRELGWLQNQKAKLFESLERMDGLRASSYDLSKLMSTKMMGLAVFGLLSMVAINLLFYRQLCKTFKERKLI